MKKHEMIHMVENYIHYIKDTQRVKMPSTTLLLLRKLIDHMNKDGFCFIKNETLMNYLQKSLRTVQSCTKYLEDNGFVVKVTRFRNNGSQKENGYQLKIDVLLGLDHELEHEKQNLENKSQDEKIDWNYYQTEAYIEGCRNSLKLINEDPKDISFSITGELDEWRNNLKVKVESLKQSGLSGNRDGPSKNKNCMGRVQLSAPP